MHGDARRKEDQDWIILRKLHTVQYHSKAYKYALDRTMISKLENVNQPVCPTGPIAWSNQVQSQ